MLSKLCKLVLCLLPPLMVYGHLRAIGVTWNYATHATFNPVTNYVSDYAYRSPAWWAIVACIYGFAFVLGFISWHAANRPRTLVSWVVAAAAAIAMFKMAEVALYSVKSPEVTITRLQEELNKGPLEKSRDEIWRAYPDFGNRDAAVLQADKTEDLHIQFRSGPHTFIAKTIEGRYPGYQHVIPSYLPESVTIPETHRPALIAWLRSLKGKSNSVRLTCETPGHLTLTHCDYDTVGATIQVPVTAEGQPPEIAFDPKHLADALEIGSTLRLVDKLNPGMATGPSGNFCLLMNRRFTEETATEQSTSETPTPAIAA